MDLIKTLICISFANLLYCFQSFAEYRAYQYLVSSSTGKEGESYLVTSTLNPVAYHQYKGGRNHSKIDLLRTWICAGNTSKQQICDSPYKEISEETFRE